MNNVIHNSDLGDIEMPTLDLTNSKDQFLQEREHLQKVKDKVMGLWAEQLNYITDKSQIKPTKKRDEKVVAEEQQCINQINEMGIKKFHGFSCNLEKITEAINGNQILENFDISELVIDKNFRFYSKEEPLLSLSVSNAISKTAKEIRKPSLSFIEEGKKKRIENADNYALEIFNTITEIRKNEKVSSYRETIRILNERNIPTSKKGKKWHVNTLQILEKRWSELGLPSNKHVGM